LSPFAKGKGKGKVGGGGGGQGSAAGGRGGGRAGGGGQRLLQEVLKAEDMLQTEGLLKHCLESFRDGLTVHTAIEQLMWAHQDGPEEAYAAKHFRVIRVIPPWGLKM
jgi:hypothetical protein